jgi:hypothetical protein
VKIPSGDERDKVLHIHASLGFPGCVTFCDGVHRPVDRVPYTQTNAHLSGKEKHPTRVVNVFGDVRGVVHHCDVSHQGTHNDKTLAKYDPFCQGLKDGTACGDDGKLYSDVKFDLYTSSDGDVKTHRGLYAFTDNGFHAWRCFQYPSKEAVSLDDDRWSTRGESVRKPSSECIFGVIKKRFPIFKDNWTFSGNANWDNAVETFDNMWFFALMLHNRLLHYDGLYDRGYHESDFVMLNVAVDRDRLLQRPIGQNNVPARRGAFMMEEDEDDATYDPDHDSLHLALVTHFKYAWERNEIKWLKTAKVCRGLRADTRPLGPGHRRHVVGGDAEDEGGAGGFASDYSTEGE